MKKNTQFFIRKFLENRPAFFGLIRPIEANLIFENKKLLKGKILDFGCGDGFFSSLIFDDKEIQVGLDIEESRIFEAEDKGIYQSLVKYDGKKVPFRDNYFDGVISNSVLEHVDELETNLKEISRVLKRRGYFVTTVMTVNWDDNMLGGKFFGESYLNWMRKKQQHLNLLSTEDWEKIFIKSGFIVEKKVGYLGPKSSKMLELWHYLSFPSLISHAIIKRWVLIKKWYVFLGIEKVFEAINSESFSEKMPSSVFYILKKV